MCFTVIGEVSPEAIKPKPKPKPETNDNKENSMSSRIESLTIQEDVKEGEAEDDEGLPIYPYERLKISSTDPAAEIDVTKREVRILTKQYNNILSFLHSIILNSVLTFV